MWRRASTTRRITPSVEGAFHGRLHIPVWSDADSYDAKTENQRKLLRSNEDGRSCWAMRCSAKSRKTLKIIVEEGKHDEDNLDWCNTEKLAAPTTAESVDD